jgi:hypothetical protein
VYRTRNAKKKKNEEGLKRQQRSQKNEDTIKLGDGYSSQATHSTGKESTLPLFPGPVPETK